MLWIVSPEIALSNGSLDYVDLAMYLIKNNVSILKSKEGVVATHSDVGARMVARTALAHDYVARDDCLTAKFLNAEALRVAIASVA